MEKRQLDRIRLLSARFNELQGLRLVLAGLSLALFFGAYVILVPQPTNNGAIVVTALAFVPVVPGMWWFNRYYREAFGRQVTKPSKQIPLFFVMYFVASWWMNKSFPEIPAGMPTIAIVSAASVFVAVRDWPFRAYYLGIAAAMALGFAASAIGGGFLPENLTLATLFMLLGVTLVPVGVLDHLLLVKLMKESRAPVSAQ